ncbi:Calmodulin [Eumeta japonica]|uniref:Calmodulin n=1 Tax=Eumeta variegata TaxID=151549 RepID=A0A4C1ZAM0_EUMVA|nr:Calmodulin [Eumeta japonica]
MPPKKDKGKGKKEEPPKAAPRPKREPPPPPRKLPRPPKCFTKEDVKFHKALFKSFDEAKNGKIPLPVVPVMLRKVGFNPSPADLEKLFEMFVENKEDDFIELHQWFFMVEAKMKMPDTLEFYVMEACRYLGHDDKKTGVIDVKVLRKELMSWGERLGEDEFAPWIPQCRKEKLLNNKTGEFFYIKFIDVMNSKDHKFFPEPMNYWKLDQRTLAELARKKAEEERAEQKRLEEERRLIEKYGRIPTP